MNPNLVPRVADGSTPERPNVRPTVAIYNPLPNALHHYVAELRDTLARCGVEAQLFPAPGVEGVRTRLGKARRLLSHIRATRVAARSADVVLCIWPVLGWYEVALWSTGKRKSSGENLLIIHDPTPLRSQVGLNRKAARIALLLARGTKPTIATHSSNAGRIVSEVLREPTVDLLHPILTAGPERAREEHRPLPRVGVFGQYKPSRDVELLSSLARHLNGYDLTMAGTGWPAVAGWKQDTRFLTEEELTSAIMDVDAVLIPNTAYYQSGIAIRAMELGVPVVGMRTPFLEDLCGDDYPGIVDGGSTDDWLSAISRIPELGVQRQRASYQDRVDDGWTRWLTNASPEKVGPRG